MHSGRRVALLRTVSLVAVGVSAALTADSLHPGRTFCPLEAACERAKSSALGTLLGVPTSILGMAAFGSFFLFSLLPVEWSRRWLRLGGAMAAMAGAALFAYQAYVLRSFCPLCLVADTSGLVAGVIAITWPKLPIHRSGRRLAGESGRSRVRWLFAAACVVVAPFVWPRPEAPAWEEIQAPQDFAEDEAPVVPAPSRAAPIAAAPSPGPPPVYVRVPSDPKPDRPAETPREGPPPVVGRMPYLPAPSAAAPVADAPDASPAPAPAAPSPAAAAAASRTATPEPRAEAPAAVPIVEYLNAYCAHCRATHRRLEQVLADSGIQVRRHRIYVWAGNDVPMWARACAYAATLGLEDRMFQELLAANGETPAEIYAAASRAGIDPSALQAALRDPNLSPRLVRDRRIAQSAHLRGLPTLDIGRRRLMGEQSEGELLAALRAAMPAPER